MGFLLPLAMTTSVILASTAAPEGKVLNWTCAYESVANPNGVFKQDLTLSFTLDTTVAKPAAIGPITPPPTTPASEIRELVFIKGRSGGSSRGTAAARVTPYALEETRVSSAAGKSRAWLPEAIASPMTMHMSPRMAKVRPIAQRRPWPNRSSSGPISGATIANGTMVSPKKSAT